LDSRRHRKAHPGRTLDFTWLLEPMLEHSGFQIEDASYSPDGIFAKYIARAA
jgi:hypothetical protein